jgi:hypothetical protein
MPSLPAHTHDSQWQGKCKYLANNMCTVKSPACCFATDTAHAQVKLCLSRSPLWQNLSLHGHSLSCSDWQNILRAYWMTVMNAASKSPSHMQECTYTSMHAFDCMGIVQKTYACVHGYVCFIQMCALWQPKNLLWGTTSLQVHVSHTKKNACQRIC